MARRNPLLKVVLGLGALALLGYLFATTLRDVGSEPYTVRTAQLRQWTVDLGALGHPDAPALVLRPPTELPLSLFDQVFQRTMESYSTPAEPAIPLVLRQELVSAPAVGTAESLFNLARGAGLGTAVLEPRCVAVYRTSGGREQRLFFVLFELPEFDQFRLALGERVRAVDSSTTFDPRALSPALLVASTDPSLLGAVPPRDALEQSCEAPVASEG